MIDYFTMLKGFPSNPKPIGLLAHDKDVDMFSMHVDPALVDVHCLPILFGFDGTSHPNDYVIRVWIDSRTIPPDRVGIEAILAELHLAEYDGWEILKAANGRNPGCDNWGFEQTDTPNPDCLNKLVWERGGPRKRTCNKA